MHKYSEGTEFTLKPTGNAFFFYTETPNSVMEYKWGTTLLESNYTGGGAQKYIKEPASTPGYIIIRYKSGQGMRCLNERSGDIFVDMCSDSTSQWFKEVLEDPTLSKEKEDAEKSRLEKIAAEEKEKEFSKKQSEINAKEEELKNKEDDLKKREEEFLKREEEFRKMMEKEMAEKSKNHQEEIENIGGRTSQGKSRKYYDCRNPFGYLN
ncbi:hypothetical protein EHP00_1167 [Ecytonucleospora hepatopenaei]|uniref:Uncharacterized protein n=1 Tax=Ecytonucleospora hepatopenaei TaxID=646526 RepID=A0A1W0E4A7_9MICR|nr:hypothetical protein EHP00_1167 [Ecytonucleospora hepatopenaei]